MATRADVARLAGVSPSTVSYVLSGARPIGEATRARVLAALEELAYQPNALAAGLAGGRSKVLALHIPTRRRPVKESDLEYLVGAVAAAAEYQHVVLLWTSEGNEAASLHQLLGGGLVAGLLLMEVDLDDHRIPLLASSRVPFALIGRTADPTGLAWADRDFEGATRTAVAHLAELGHRHIAFLDAPGQLRDSGYGVSARASKAAKAAARDAGIGLVVMEHELTVEAGHAALRRLRSRHPHVTGVVAFNDEATMGLYQEAAATGLDIPGELSLVSASLPTQRVGFFHPAITTISPPAEAIAASATRQLLTALGVPDIPEQPKLWAGELVVRRSTARPPLID